MLHVALLFTFYLGPKARFDILCTGFTWFLTSQLAASRPPGRLRRLSIQESLANVRKKEFLHNSKAEHTKWHTKCHRCTDLPDDWGWRLRMSVSWDKEYYDVRKHVFCFALGHILLNLSPANCHLFAALNIRKVRFWPKKSSSGWHTWNLVISTAQLDFFHEKIENHSIQVMHGLCPDGNLFYINEGIFMSHKNTVFVGKFFIFHQFSLKF